MKGSFPVAFAALVSSVVLSSCLISSGVEVDIHGDYVDHESASQVEVGQSQEYVCSLLGEPSAKTVFDDGGEMWKWDWTEERESKVSILFALSSKRETRGHEAFHVEFSGGMVVRSWND